LKEHDGDLAFCWTLESGILYKGINEREEGEVVVGIFTQHEKKTMQKRKKREDVTATFC